jgi:hypothetical protein
VPCSSNVEPSDSAPAKPKKVTHSELMCFAQRTVCASSHRLIPKCPGSIGSATKFDFARTKKGSMSVHLVNPSDNSFGTAVITPRWLFVLAAATPAIVGEPILVDESLEQIEPESISTSDIVGISVHTGNALRGYAVGRLAKARGAWVVYGGIHATLFPEEPFELGQADAVVRATAMWRGDMP